ncbi:MAG TPA: PQQ-dependent dehydrogenase, methanol/ethanol family [Steroidobacteraceae bacterium]|jgi:alcohol dehydrogenase (cytochrome c)/quinohemoprotein ethanol dehydrogenase|nr:PQQ-dependent dehydrogenase, methanol/ethanol family [Steroidobacteraceae bacterium]
MRPSAIALACVMLLAGCTQHDSTGTGAVASAPAAVAAPQPMPVDAARLLGAGGEGDNWLTYGRTYDEHRFSPLQQINAANVSGLKPAWHFVLPVDARAQESTPLIIDGVMYVTAAWSHVYALDAATGALKWTYDPKVPGHTGVDACCDVVNRGLAAWQGRLYLGTLDGRLVALDAASGMPVWEVRTIPEGSRATITGAPRIIKGKVIIGNGGGEESGRGFVSAYDAESGRLIWRFYTVPGKPGLKDGAASDAILEKVARRTWRGQWWQGGGGGTVWDAMAYDPQLDLLYFGTDNGGPWNKKFRSPGTSDDLFITSIIAVRADSGEYVWHFQNTPGEMWDYSATQSLVLADLTIGGQLRHVIMQAPKNGYFYVLDRQTGKPISIHQYVDALNWAQGVDPLTGRPKINPEALYDHTGKPWVGAPGPAGGHNWMPMSFSPQTGLVYVPVIEVSFPYIGQQTYHPTTLTFNVGIDQNAGSLPQDPVIKAAALKGLKGHLSAWDPVAQKEVWRVAVPYPWNGGTLATAGHVVYEGDAMGKFNAYGDADGKLLWSVQTGTGILAPPVSYAVNGKQYIAVEAGWGGAFALSAGELALRTQINRGNVPRILVFSLDGMDTLAPVPAASTEVLAKLPELGNAAQVAQGKLLYHTFCGNCHGDTAVSGGTMPDLRYSAALRDDEGFQKIVHDGVLEAKGMVAFGSLLTPAKIELIRAYVTHRVNESMAEQPVAKAVQ